MDPFKILIFNINKKKKLEIDLTCLHVTIDIGTIYKKYDVDDHVMIFNLTESISCVGKGIIWSL